jgi:hypothetical protein
MLQQTTLQGMSTAHLEQLRTQIALQFFADETTDNDREEMCKFDDMVMNCIPHSFVLASLFDVEAMCNEIPDHIYESDPSLEGVTCPCCDGEKWLEVEGNVLVWHGVSEVDATIKTTSQNPRTTPVSTELWRLAA